MKISKIFSFEKQDFPKVWMKCLEIVRLHDFAPNTPWLLGPPCPEVGDSWCESTNPPLEIPAYGCVYSSHTRVNLHGCVYSSHTRVNLHTVLHTPKKIINDKEQNYMCSKSMTFHLFIVSPLEQGKDLVSSLSVDPFFVQR